MRCPWFSLAPSTNGDYVDGLPCGQKFSYGALLRAQRLDSRSGNHPYRTRGAKKVIGVDVLNLSPFTAIGTFHRAVNIFTLRSMFAANCSEEVMFSQPLISLALSF